MTGTLLGDRMGCDDSVAAALRHRCLGFRLLPGQSNLLVGVPRFLVSSSRLKNSQGRRHSLEVE
jgi:hypothetical protein